MNIRNVHLMIKTLQYFLCGAMMVTTINVFAMDCDDCKSKGISKASMQNNPSVDISAHDRLFIIQGYCMKFSFIEQQMVGTTIKEMEGTPISPEEFLTTPVCQPRGYSNAVKSPMIHIVADDITKREEFLQNIWLYYSKKRKQPEIFDHAINTKNTKGETLLDYLETMKQREYYTIDTQQQALNKVIAMLCSHGGVYAVRKDMQCP